jgi:anhydro-N-acetylmuramic acid kinase
LLTTADFGIPIDAKECVSFAVLAAARMDGVPANLPQVTGAKRRVVLGDISAG